MCYLIKNKRFHIFYIFLTLFGWSWMDKSGPRPRTLVLTDDHSLLKSHSDLINMISHMNHEITINSFSQQPKTFIFNHKHFENVLVIVKDSSDNSLFDTIDDLVKFIDIGGNLMLIFDTNAPSEIRHLVNQLGYNVYSAGSLIYSNNRISLDNEDAFALDPLTSVINATAIVDRSSLKSPLIYRGNALKHTTNNKWTINIVSASENDLLYSASTDSVNPTVIKGIKMALIGAVQMRNNHRVSIIPSIEFASNKYFNDLFISEKLTKTPQLSSNKEFMKELFYWTFMEKSVLRVSNPSHKLISSSKPKQQYSVMEKIEYGVQIEEKTPKGWKPFVNNSVKFALERIITHMRMRYNATNDGMYTASFQIPDYIGLYKCTTEFDVIGYTKLDHYVQIVVRPRRHDEFPRYIVKCWPFYFTCFLMFGLTIVLSFVIINIKDDKKKSE